MIRSIRSISSQSSVWIPGLCGPAEPFDCHCIPGDHWQVIDRHFERAIRWDLPGVSEDFVEEAVASARFHMWTRSPQHWAALKIGWGDRFRAVSSIRAYGRRCGWRFGNGRRSEARKIRPYPTSGKNGLPSPLAVAMAAEEAGKGLTGKRPGSRHVVTETMAADEVRVGMIGFPREERLGRVQVAGGTAHVQSDGRMEEIVVSRTVFLFFGGKRVGGRWMPDGSQEEMVDIETARKMVRGTTETEFEPGEVYDSAEW